MVSCFWYQELEMANKWGTCSIQNIMLKLRDCTPGQSITSRHACIWTDSLSYSHQNNFCSPYLVSWADFFTLAQKKTGKKKKLCIFPCQFTTCRGAQIYLLRRFWIRQENVWILNRNVPLPKRSRIEFPDFDYSYGTSSDKK